MTQILTRENNHHGIQTRPFSLLDGKKQNNGLGTEHGIVEK